MRAQLYSELPLGITFSDNKQFSCFLVHLYRITMAPLSAVHSVAYLLLASYAQGAYVIKQTYDASNFLNSFTFKTVRFR